MLRYKKTFENDMRANINFPVEDQYYVSDNLAIIADGITRNPIGVPDLSGCTNEEFIQKYPKPSGSEEVAKLICDTFSKVEGSLKERLIKCNEKAKELNDKCIKKCDYLENDYYAAVASCLKIEKGALNYAFIGDCGLVLYDKFGNIKFQTEDSREPYRALHSKKDNIPFDKPEGRVRWRSVYRNNLNTKYGNICVSYGAITGEESAINFIYTGQIKLDKGDKIVLYSDGFVNYIHDNDFIEQILNFNELQFEEYVKMKSSIDCKKYGPERTIILFEY